MDFPPFESRNEAKRTAAEKCFTIAKEKAKHGSYEEAAMLLRWAVELLDAMDGYDDQKGPGECPSFNGMNDMPFTSFNDLLLWKNIPASGQVKKAQGTAGKSSNSGSAEAHNLENVAESIGTRKAEVQSVDRIVKYSYVNPRLTCMGGLYASLFDSECNNETPNSPQPDLSSTETDNVDQTDCANGKKLFTETINDARTRIKNAICIFWFSVLYAVLAFATRALTSSAERAKKLYDNLKSVTVNIFKVVLRILLMAIAFVFLIACVAVKCCIAIGKPFVDITVFILLCFFGRPTDDNSYRAQCSSRRSMRRKYNATKEVPKTSKEAIRHLLSCETNDNPYETLLVDETASQEEIKKNYRRFAVLVHPDKCPSNANDADNATKILNGAHNVLGYPSKRREYDRQKVSAEECYSRMSNFRQFFPCNECGVGHFIIRVERLAENGRYCGKCDSYHKAKPGDVWIEQTLWMKELYLCLAISYFSPPEIYRFESWGRCHSKQYGMFPANSHKVLLHLKQKEQGTQHSSSPNQPETAHRRNVGKKYRTRKYKRK